MTSEGKTQGLSQSACDRVGGKLKLPEGGWQRSSFPRGVASNAGRKMEY